MLVLGFIKVTYVADECEFTTNPVLQTQQTSRVQLLLSRGSVLRSRYTRDDSSQKGKKGLNVLPCGMVLHISHSARTAAKPEAPISHSDEKLLW